MRNGKLDRTIAAGGFSDSISIVNSLNLFVYLHPTLVNSMRKNTAVSRPRRQPAPHSQFIPLIVRSPSSPHNLQFVISVLLWPRDP